MAVTPAKPAPGMRREGKAQVAQRACFVHWTGVKDIAPVDPGFDRKIRARLKQYIEGRPGVPGPLYKVVIDSRGQRWLLAAPHVKANHGGRIARSAWRSLCEGETPTVPTGEKAPPTVTTTFKNAHTHSVALDWSGDPRKLTAAAVDALIEELTDWCTATGNPVDVCIDHYEAAWWRKIDVHSGMDMDKIRTYVNRQLDKGVSEWHDVAWVTAGTAKGSPRPLLKKGVESSWVTSVRRIYLRLGYRAAYTTGNPARFGGGMDTATKQFQKARGLVCDGIIGPKTWRALVDANKPTPYRADVRNRKIAFRNIERQKSHPQARAIKARANLDMNVKMNPDTTNLSAIPNGALIAEIQRRLNERK